MRPTTITSELIKTIRRTARQEDGMSIAEVMIAALILVIGSLAVLNLMSAGAHSSYRNEQSQVVSNRLQQEMEKIQRLPYAQIALTSLPADSNNSNNPAWRVSGTSYAILQGGTQFQPLAYNSGPLYPSGTVSGGTVDPTPTPFTSGDVKGTIYRYVVWENDSSCSDADCPGTQDLKRVIVAIVLDGGPVGGGVRHYQELQTQIANPDVKPPNPGDPPCQAGCNDPNTSWTFWLSDTSCDNSARIPITGDHLLHSTTGACSSGLKDSSSCTTSCPPGAPDLMLTSAPPLTAEAPLWDYATDIEPPANPDVDKGVQMAPPSTNGCLPSLFNPLTDGAGHLSDDPDVSRMQTIHKWLSPPMGTGFSVSLSGTGTLNLWSQSVNAASYAGKICVWLYERHPDANGLPVDTAATNVGVTPNTNYFTYSQSTWPTGWSELHIQLSFTLGNLTANSQLGLAIQVEKAGTTGGGMQFLYDEPSFDSRLEVKTSSTLPF